MKRKLASVAALAMTASVLVACSNDDEAGNGIEITTSIYPLEYVAEQIGGDHVAVTSITPPGSDDHSLELSPRQVTDLENVDLVITLSNYQSAMDDAIDTVDIDRVIDAADHVNLRQWDNDEHDEHDHDHDHDDDDHDQEHDADDHEHDEADDHGHSHTGPDPHFWLDPSRMALLAGPVADELAEIDPDNADEYRANAEAFVADMEQLDSDYVAALSQCETTTFVVSHQAFGYLEDAYGLDQQSIAGIEIDIEPSPRRVAEVTSLINDAGVNVIFATSQAEMSLVSALAEETDVRVELLDAAATQLDEDVDYDQIMRNNLDLLQSALVCK